MATALFFLICIAAVGIGFIYIGVIFFHPEAKAKHPDLSFRLEGPGQLKIPEAKDSGRAQSNLDIFVQNRSPFPASLCIDPAVAFSILAKTEGGSLLHWQALDPKSKVEPLTTDDYLQIPALGSVHFSLPVARVIMPENQRFVISESFYFENLPATAEFEFRYDIKSEALSAARKLGFKNIYKGPVPATTL